MKIKILIVEDIYIEANNLRLTLTTAGYDVCGLARSVPEALSILKRDKPDLVLLDIHLDGPLTGIDLAKMLKDKNIAFVFLSANSNKATLDAAKVTRPYGFLIKPFREKDVLAMLDVALYLHQENLASVGEKGESSLAIPSANYTFQDIIGESKSFLETLKNVSVVGPSETTVLILGESGTGKELIARAIHRLSRRNAKPLTIVNCAALPGNLIESELFGHEKGSFTGAADKRIGKFEEADGGTIFLDEIGELPLDLQVKFLRVLQEKEIDPIGGKKRKVNVRVIAATNRDLEEEIAMGRFRMDLYYRLNIFPVHLPPLRERKEDILPLAMHFLSVYAKKERKTLTGLTDHVIEDLLEYAWPGNIRELENLMARCVLLADGPVVDSVKLPKTRSKGDSFEALSPLKSIDENERDHILAALEKSNWKVFGERGAATMLKMNAWTLNSRMKKLGIKKK
jgi:DNA-binding NtrC family response regulator